jgi:phage shock protein C
MREKDAIAKFRDKFYTASYKECRDFLTFANMVSTIKNWFEEHAFGVCGWLGGKLGMKSTKIRMYFIYLSFFTFGSPVIVYFILAFLLEHKEFLKPTKYRRRSVWDI